MCIWFFLLLGDIPSCEYTNIYIWLFILFPMGIRALFNFEAFEYSCYEHSLSRLLLLFFFGSFAFICVALNFLRNLGVELPGHMLTLSLLGHMLTLCLPFWGSMFSKAGTLFHIPTSSTGGFRFLHIRTNTCSNFLTFQVMLVDVEWYLIVVLISICLMANDVEHLFKCLLVFCLSSVLILAHFLLGIFVITIEL